MSHHAYFSQTHADRGGAIYRWRTEQGDMVDCTAVSMNRPWNKDSYFDDAEYRGEVEYFVRKVQDADAKKAKQFKGAL